MRSIRRQLTLLIIGFMVTLTVALVLATVWQIRDKAVVAAVEKAKSDLNTFEAILNLKYPGQWHVDGGTLYKGNTRVNDNDEIVDYISELTGDTCTIFLGDRRVATTVRAVGGQRAIGTTASDIVKQTVLQNGGEYMGEANVVGKTYQAAYKPIHDANSNIIGMIYVGAPKEFYRQLLYGTLISVSIVIICLIILSSLAIRFYVEFRIVRPLKELARDTREISAHGVQNASPVTVSGPNEIKELVVAFNQMVESLSDLRRQISTLPAQDSATKKEMAMAPDKEPQLTGSPFSFPTSAASYGPGPEDGSPADKNPQYLLPKGLNQVTLNQILSFLSNEDTFLTAEEVSEQIKVSRVTAMRYMDFLVDRGHLDLELKYGAVGRPLKMYKRKCS